MAKPCRALSLRDNNPEVPLEDLILAATMNHTRTVNQARDILRQTIHPFPEGSRPSSEVSVVTAR